MFAYTHDAETGGLLLNDSTPMFSKEPRPVYAPELDTLGFDKHFQYSKQEDVPYMWAEANCYWYRGEIVAKTKGGNLYSKPELEIVLNGEGNPILQKKTRLKEVDIVAMVEKNRILMEVISQNAMKKVFDIYKRYKKKLDCFHVAFSGGKDSIVMLDLVMKSLPKSSFVVVFGDTGMEFPDTYVTVDEIEQQCRNAEILFYRAESHFNPNDSWRLFGPPSRTLRWCCYVHKSAPQTLKLREVLGKVDYTGMDFVGVRVHESTSRFDYTFENYGEKQKGQFSHNPILDWTSAEVWIYTFAENLVINRAYKLGNPRAGCLFCPMGGGKADSFRNITYPSQIENYTNIIRELVDDKNIESYITNGGWVARQNGRDLKNNPSRCIEQIIDGQLEIRVINPKSDINEWIKTLGDIPYSYTIIKKEDGYVFSFSERIDKTPYAKLFKQVTYKSAYCVECRVCEANCRNGCISFSNGLSIENCDHCGQCHSIRRGCLVYNSVQQPKNGGTAMKSLNSFADHAPKPDWVRLYFDKPNEFLADNSLGPMQISIFKKFLSHATLIEKNASSNFTELVRKIGWNTEQAWGLILIQLAYNNPQIRWYIEKMSPEEEFPRKSIEDMLMSLAITKKDASSIIKAFKRLCELPLGKKLNFGTVTDKGRNIDTLTRLKCTLEDNRVILYSLYKFAETCEGYFQFTLSRLLDHTVESPGLSPTLIFGLDRNDMERYLNGLSAEYPEFINVTFTHDLDKISLREDKTSEDVLTLF